MRQYVGPVLKELAERKECKIEEGHLLADHVHVLISIPPKYSVAQVVGFIKGKSAISIARNYMGRRRNFTDRVFGRGDIMFQQLEGMKRSSEITFVTKKLKIVGSIN